jgi:hypothetical protein
MQYEQEVKKLKQEAKDIEKRYKEKIYAEGNKLQFDE